MDSIVYHETEEFENSQIPYHNIQKSGKKTNEDFVLCLENTRDDLESCVQTYVIVENEPSITHNKKIILREKISNIYSYLCLSKRYFQSIALKAYKPFKFFKNKCVCLFNQIFIFLISSLVLPEIVLTFYNVGLITRSTKDYILNIFLIYNFSLLFSMCTYVFYRIIFYILQFLQKCNKSSFYYI